MIEEWVQLAIKGVMHESVADACLVDIAGLGVADFEVTIAAVLVCAGDEVVMQLEDILHQITPELLYIGSFLLPSHEFLPRIEEILDRGDILIRKIP